MSTNHLSNYNLQFSEEQQQWHHDYGRQPDGNGYVTVGENFGPYHSAIFNQDGIADRTARLTTGEARIIAKEINYIAKLVVMAEFIGMNNLSWQLIRFMRQRGFVLADMPEIQP